MSDKSALNENIKHGASLTEAQRHENLARGLLELMKQLDQMESRQKRLQDEVELVRDIVRRIRN